MYLARVREPCSCFTRTEPSFDSLGVRLRCTARDHLKCACTATCYSSARPYKPLRCPRAPTALAGRTHDQFPSRTCISRAFDFHTAHDIPDLRERTQCASCVHAHCLHARQNDYLLYSHRKRILRGLYARSNNRWAGCANAHLMCLVCTRLHCTVVTNSNLASDAYARASDAHGHVQRT